METGADAPEDSQDVGSGRPPGQDRPESETAALGPSGVLRIGRNRRSDRGLHRRCSGGRDWGYADRTCEAAPLMRWPPVPCSAPRHSGRWRRVLVTGRCVNPAVPVRVQGGPQSIPLLRTESLNAVGTAPTNGHLRAYENRECSEHGYGMGSHFFLRAALAAGRGRSSGPAPRRPQAREVRASRRSPPCRTPLPRPVASQPGPTHFLSNSLRDGESRRELTGTGRGGGHPGLEIESLSAPMS